MHPHPITLRLGEREEHGNRRPMILHPWPETPRWLVTIALTRIPLHPSRGWQKIWGAKIFILSEQQYFVWDIDSQSTKRLDMLKIWWGLARGYAYRPVGERQKRTNQGVCCVVLHRQAYSMSGHNVVCQLRSEKRTSDASNGIFRQWNRTVAKKFSMGVFAFVRLHRGGGLTF